MVNHASSVEIVVAPQEIVTGALVEPEELPIAVASTPSDNYSEVAVQPEQSNENGFGWRRAASRAAAGAALAVTGFLMLGAEQEAVATTTVATTAAANQSSFQESGIGFSLGGVVTGSSIVFGFGSLLVAERSLRSQIRDKQQDRFIDTLVRVAGESDAERRQAVLNILALYAEDPRQAPRVFRAAVAYLKGRRSAIDDVRGRIENGETGNSAPEEPTNFLDSLNKTMKSRRNPDREMVQLLITTLPAARENMQTSRRNRFIGRTIGKLIGTHEENKVDALRKITGFLPARTEGLVDAAGINLDLMRDALVDCDLSDTSFNGAGMQANNLMSVVFEGCDLQLVQLEGATMVGCDIRRADFGGAQFSGDPSDPYFMGKTTFIRCVIDKNTKFGHLPDEHPKARHNSNDPAQPEAYRGGGELTLKDLKVMPGTLSYDDMIELVHSWQRTGGLKLSADSNRDYIYNPKSS